MSKRILSLLLVVMMMSTLFISLAHADGWTMYVYTDNGRTLNVRSDPTGGKNIIGRLNYGSAVSVRMTMANGWAAIDYAAGVGGVAYVQSRFLVNSKPAPKTPTPIPTKSVTPITPAASSGLFDSMNAEFRSAVRVSPYTVIARPSRASGWVNLRWAPSTEAERIATCPQGKELTVLAQTSSWYQVQDPQTGMIGFIMQKFVYRK